MLHSNTAVAVANLCPTYASMQSSCLVNAVLELFVLQVQLRQKAAVMSLLKTLKQHSPLQVSEVWMSRAWLHESITQHNPMMQ